MEVCAAGLDELLSTLCSFVFLQITRLGGCILALVAFAGQGPGVSRRAGARRFTRHLSTTLGLADWSTTASSTLPSFLSSPTPRTLSLLCSILLPRLAHSAHQRQTHWQQPPAPFAQNTEQLSCKQHLDSRCLAWLPSPPSPLPLCPSSWWIQAGGAQPPLQLSRLVQFRWQDSNCHGLLLLRSPPAESGWLVANEEWQKVNSVANPFNKLPPKWAWGSAAMRGEHLGGTNADKLPFSRPRSIFGCQAISQLKPLWRRGKRGAHQQLLGSEPLLVVRRKKEGRKWLVGQT